mmetsp:Transcript_11045/g.40875  ORF Transcript_11045/g.40875 Transcript_11045/m.40875 type:complete len:304 (-) Transcript_11045:1051-1962(-)
MRSRATRSASISESASMNSPRFGVETCSTEASKESCLNSALTCSAAKRNEREKWFPLSKSSARGFPVTPTTSARPPPLVGFEPASPVSIADGPTTTSGLVIFFTTLSASCKKSANLNSASGCLNSAASLGEPWSRSEKYRNPPTVRITALFASAKPPCRISARWLRMACLNPTCISSYWDIPSALTARQKLCAPPTPPSPVSESSEPLAEGTPSSSAVTPCTTSVAGSFILNPCPKEKLQNFKSSSPWLGPCCSSLLCSCWTCSGDMCVYCCLHASRGNPRCAKSECNDARPASLHVCNRVAT